MEITTQNARLKIDLEGGYVLSWMVKNPATQEFEEIFYQGSVKQRTGIPILFPYFGRGGARRKHGFGRDSKWTTTSSSQKNTFTMSLTDKDIDEKAKGEYPYQFATDIILTVDEVGSLVYELQVKNTGTVPLPIVPGLHPYFAIDQKSKKQITTEGLPGFDASIVDWDNSPPDSRFPFLGKAVLRFPTRLIAIEDKTEHEKVVKYFAVWSQSIDKPDYNFVCFEPICGLDEDIDNAPTLIQPQETWRMKITFSVSFI